MKDKSKKILLIILIFLIIPHTSTSADLIIPKKKPKNIDFVKFCCIMVPSTGYAPVAESYQDPVLLLN